MDAATRLLADCAAFVEAVPESVYQETSVVLAGGTIGKHARHLLDHFMAIVRAVEDGSAICYDRREREVEMERSRDAAVVELRRAARVLAEFCGEIGERSVRVRLVVDARRGEVEVGSTLARELLFATHHAVHHCAMMKAIAVELGVQESRGGETFGIAPATIQSLRNGNH